MNEFKRLFRYTTDWEPVKLSALVVRNSERNVGLNDNVLTISAQHGLIRQELFFNRRVASKDLSNYYVLQRGDFAYNKSYSKGYPFGAIKRLKHHSSGVVSPLYICFRTKRSKCEPDYLNHLLEAGALEEGISSIAKEGARAHGLVNVGVDDFFGLPVYLPESRAEQTKIAEILSTTDRAIERTEALIAKQQCIKAGLMQDLLTRGIDDDGNLRSERTHEFKDSPLGRIPCEWLFQSVRDTGKVTGGRQLAPKYMQSNNRTPYLRVANVLDGWIDFSDVLSMEFSARDKDKYFLTAGDVLLNEGQSIELVGRSALYRGPDNVFCFQNTLIRYRAYECMRADFAQTVFKWWLDAGMFRDVARRTTSVAHLGVDRFAQMLIVRPPRAEQDRIMQVLLPADDTLVELTRSSTKLRRLKAGLMQDLLTGRRRVTALLPGLGVARS